MSAANASSGGDDGRKLPAQGKTFTHQRKPPPGSKLPSDAEDSLSSDSEGERLCCYDPMIYTFNQDCKAEHEFKCPESEQPLVKCPTCREYYHDCCLQYVRKHFPQANDGVCVICNKGLPGAIECDMDDCRMKYMPDCTVKYFPGATMHSCQNKLCGPHRSSHRRFHEQCYDELYYNEQKERRGSFAVKLNERYNFCLPCAKEKVQPEKAQPKSTNTALKKKSDQKHKQDEEDEEDLIDYFDKMSGSAKEEGDTDDKPRRDESEANLDTELQTAFKGQKAFRQAGIKANEKRDRLKKLTTIDAASLFTGDRLDDGNARLETLKKVLSANKNATIDLLAPLAMRLGALLHRENCRDKRCGKCGGYNPESPHSALDENDITPESIRVAEMYDLSWVHASSQAALQEQSGDVDHATCQPARAKNSKRTAVMFSVAKGIDNFRIRSNMTDALPCPLCGHKLVQRLHTQRTLDAHKRQVDEQFEERKAKHDALPPTMRSKSPPRRGKFKVQEFICGCYMNPGTSCSCCVGPFTNKERQTLAADFQDYQMVRRGQDAQTVSSQFSTGNFLNFMVESTLKRGARDLQLMGLNASASDVMGAAAAHLALADVPDNEKNEIGRQMGRPTDILPSGQNICAIQELPRDRRYYRNRLGTQSTANNNPTSNTLDATSTSVNNYLNSMSGASTRHADGVASRGMGVDPRQSAASRGNDGTSGGTLGRRRNAPATPVGTAGVPVKRTKKQLRIMVKKGTPNTVEAAAETLDDVAIGTRNAAVETIIEAEEDEDCTESQEVALDAIALKKLQIKRRKEEKES